MMVEDFGVIGLEIPEQNFYYLQISLTSQKNSLPRRPQNHEIQDTSSELLIFLVEGRVYYNRDRC